MSFAWFWLIVSLGVAGSEYAKTRDEGGSRWYAALGFLVAFFGWPLVLGISISDLLQRTAEDHENADRIEQARQNAEAQS